MKRTLLEKYDVAAPRYTSYPTVPYWDETPVKMMEWLRHVQVAANGNISLYIHLPFCENLCTYCGCSKRITKNHKVERPYIEALLQEWQIYVDALPFKPTISEIHLGGGTPTFFDPEHLRRLFVGILQHAKVADNYEFSFEAHPNNTTFDHLHTLHQLGFNRVSIGVQDFDNRILTTINRQQTVEDVERVTEEARSLGYASINYDLVYGLPFQTNDNIKQNIKYIKKLKPDRIAFYSYAHVPWKSPSQRAYSEADLPMGAAKRGLYELGERLLTSLGYVSIGMDHFALATDELAESLQRGTLHRNFMGYTPRYTSLLIGLGASAIGDSWTAFAQNEKNIEIYQDRVANGELPIIKGHILSQEDKILRKHILNLMCRYRTDWSKPELFHPSIYTGLKHTKALEEDGLVNIQPTSIEITDFGKPFVRNICMALDTHYWRRQNEEHQVFSKVV